MKRVKTLYKVALVITTVTIVTGCMTNPRISKDLSSGKIGCSPSDITIQNETASFGGTHTWTAICKDERYICNYHTTTGANCALAK